MLSMDSLLVISNIVNFCEREETECELKFYISDDSKALSSRFSLYVNFRRLLEKDKTLLSLMTSPIKIKRPFLFSNEPAVFISDRFLNELTEQFIKDIYKILREHRLYCINQDLVSTLESTETIFYFNQYKLVKIQYKFLYSKKENKVFLYDSIEELINENSCIKGFGFST